MVGSKNWVVMGQDVSLTAAKAHLAGLVQAAETGEVVHISRHGKPVAVLISEQSYMDLQTLQRGKRVWDAIQSWRDAARARHDDAWPLASGPMGVNDVEAWRDRSSGREVQLG